MAFLDSAASLRQSASEGSRRVRGQPRRRSFWQAFWTAPLFPYGVGQCHSSAYAKISAAWTLAIYRRVMGGLGRDSCHRRHHLITGARYANLVKPLSCRYFRYLADLANGVVVQLARTPACHAG